MKYLIASCIQEDRIYTGTGTPGKSVLGGAGLYAYAGIRLFEERVKLICNVEKGHFGKNGEWYRRNQVVLDGICESLEDDGVTVITYFSDGTRSDMPSEGLERKRKRNPSVSQIEKGCQEAAGLYLFRHLDEPYLREVIRLSKKYGFRIMWEIAADAATEANKDIIAALGRQISIFSINMQEAESLLSTKEKAQVIRYFQQEGFPMVFLRNGAEGGYMVLPKQVFFCPSVPGCRAVDTTGAGNASSAAVLYGICQGEHPAMAGIRGAVAASYVIAQYGPPAKFTPKISDEAEQAVINMYQRQVWRKEDGSKI